MKVEFSAKAWALSLAAGLACVPALEAEAWPGPEETKAAVTAQAEDSTPAKPARRSFLSRLFGKKTRPAATTTATKPAAQNTAAKQSAASEPKVKVAAKPAGGKSEVMRQLEEMYRRNGRQMPNFMTDAEKQAAQRRTSAPAVTTKTSAKAQQPAPAMKPEPTIDSKSIAEKKPQSAQKPAAQIAKNSHKASQISTTTSEGKAEKKSAIKQVAGPLSRFFGRLRGGRNPNDERPKQVYRMSPADLQAQKNLYQGTTPEREYLPQNAKPAPAISIVPPVPEAATKPGIPIVEPEPVKEPELLAPEAPAAEPAKPVEQPIAEAAPPKLPEFDPAVELPTETQPKVAEAEPKIAEAPPEDAGSEPQGDDPFAGLTAEPAESESAPKLPEPNGIDVAADAKPASDQTPEAQTPEIEIEPAQEPADEPAPKSEHEEKLQKIAERSELSGLKGFCPVVLRDERDLRDAVPEFTTDFEGRAYNFSSEEALKKFEANPTAYAPAASGHDVVLKSDAEEQQDGTLDYAVWFKDRLYLFSSKDTLDTFVISPAKYAIAKESKE